MGAALRFVKKMNTTVYVSNINDRAPRNEVIRSLSQIFNQYGLVRIVKLGKSIVLRGQAFIVFEDAQCAQRALKVDGFPFFNKRLVVTMAKAPSYVTVRREGGDTRGLRRQRAAKKAEREEKRKAMAAKAQGNMMKRLRKEEDFRAVPDEMLPPNKILFLQHLPTETTKEMLLSIFAGFMGFVEIRLIPGKRDIAFVEYETESEAAIAKNALDGHPILPEHLIKVTFARK